MALLSDITSTLGKAVGAFQSLRNRPTPVSGTTNPFTETQTARSAGISGYQATAPRSVIGNPLLSNQGYSYTPPAVQPAAPAQPITPPVNQGLPQQSPNAGAYTYSGGVNAQGQSLAGYNPQPTYTPPPLSINAGQTPTTDQLSKAQNGFATPTTDYTQGITNSNSNIQSVIDKIFGTPAINPAAQTAETNLTNTNQQFNDVTAQINKLTADAQATMENINPPGTGLENAQTRISVFDNQFRKNIQPLVNLAETLKGQAANYQQQVQFQQTSANDLMSRQIAAGNLGVNLAQLPIQQATAMANLLKQDTSITEANGRRVIVNNQTGKVVADLGVADAKNSTSGIMDSVLDSFLIKGLQNRNIEFNSLPRAEKQSALAAFARQGIPFPRQLTTREENLRPEAISGLNAVQNIERMLEKNGGLPLLRSDYLPGFAARLLGASDYIRNASELTDVITRIRTGAALNDSEITFYANEAPKAGDSAADIINKLNHFKGLYLGTAGLPVTIFDPNNPNDKRTFNDLFDLKQRLDMREAISNGGIVED